MLSYPISLSRGAYWLARSYEKIGDKVAISFNGMNEASKYLINLLWSVGIILKIKPNEKFKLRGTSKKLNLMAYRELFL